MGVRVYELARTLGRSSKDLMHELKRQGIDLKSHMSSIDEETAELVADLLKASPPPSVKDTLVAPPVVEEEEESLDENTLSTSPMVVTAETAVPAPMTPTPVVIQEQPFVVVEPPKTASAVEAPAVVKAPPEKHLRLGEAVTVKELAEKMNARPAEVIRVLMKLGVMATLNAVIDLEKATALAQSFGYSVEAAAGDSGEAFIDEGDREENLAPRAPVVTVMGHVDHGKTSLLDAIRATNITQSEAGGITQHIGAYAVNTTRGNVVFLDTPGHEAFTAMRARGAQATDIVVLVVAADDGVMPQTLEAIAHVQAANVPIIVAINKIDSPGANPDRVRQQLANANVIVEQFGGDVPSVEVSAKLKQNIDGLLEMILLVADLQEFKAHPNAPAVGTIVEAEMDRARGPIATALIQNGTLRPEDTVLVGGVTGTLRAMFTDSGKKLRFAEPAMPVVILGLNEVPQAGDILQAMKDLAIAREVATQR